MLAGATGGFVTHVLERPATTGASTAPKAILPAEAAGQGLSIPQIVAKVEPAVVTVRAEYAHEVSFGTGIVVASNGEVLTNAHVVSRAQSIFVTLDGQEAVRRAVLLSLDTSADLALLRIDGAVGLVSAQLGSSASLRVGDAVVAIGNALDLPGGFTVTHGIVSALDRYGDSTLSGLIQIDAGISSGMSGGPLVDAAGRIVGINSRFQRSTPTSDAEDIGFAIPSDRAASDLVHLRRNAHR
jgi:putative serine protease PepD